MDSTDDAESDGENVAAAEQAWGIGVPDLKFASTWKTVAVNNGSNGTNYVYHFTVTNNNTGYLSIPGDSSGFWVRVYNVYNQHQQSYWVSSLADGASVTLTHVVDDCQPERRILIDPEGAVAEWSDNNNSYTFVGVSGPAQGCL